MTSWCKVAADLDFHPKIRKAGRDGREVFLFILRRNAQGDYEGRLPVINVDLNYLSEQLMMDEVTARNGLSRACDAGLLSVTERFVVVKGWETEWSKKSMGNAERQARHRQKLKDAAELEINSNGLSHEVTSVTEDQSRSEKIRLDKSTKNSARPARGPRALDLTASESASVDEVLTRLSAKNGVRYSGTDAHRRLIAGRLRDGFTEMDLRKIIGYCAEKWEGKPDMLEYLRPETLFGPQTIAKYLDPARAWFDKLPADRSAPPQQEASAQ